MKNLISRNLFLILILFSCFDATSCTCIGESNPVSELKNSDLVFVGKVNSIVDFNVPHHLANRIMLNLSRTSFAVEYYWKGKVFSNTISIVSGRGNGDCGFVFNEGKRYIVYAKKREQYFEDSPEKAEHFYTNICFRTTTQISEEEIHLEKIKKIQKRFPKQD